MAQKDLGQVEFAPVTIFYGGNGSGKSTILNVIARSIGVRRMSEGNTSDYFHSYTRLCNYESLGGGIYYHNLCFIRSEDIMDEDLKQWLNSYLLDILCGMVFWGIVFGIAYLGTVGKC